MIKRILFVCLGNICRSPSAEGVVRAKAQARGMAVEVDSAGTGEWHLGEPPYRPMQAAARGRGYDLSNQRARRVAAADFDRFDLIVAIDPDNLRDLQALSPISGGATLALFTDFAPELGMDAVPDPYFTRDFDGVLDLVERCADGLLDRL